MTRARVVGPHYQSAWSADNTEGHTSRRRRRRATAAFVVLLLLVLADAADRVCAQDGNANDEVNGDGKDKGHLVTTSRKTTVQSGILGVFLIMMGLLLCAAGRRWMRLTCSIVGWLLWGGACWVAMANSETFSGYGNARSTAYLVLPIVVGIMGGLLFVILHLAALMFAGALAGLALAFTIMSVREGGLFGHRGFEIVALAVLGSFGLILMLLYERNVRNWPIILCTSIIGAYTTVFGLDQFVHTGLSNVVAASLDHNVAHDQSEMAHYGIKGGLYVLLILEVILAIGGIFFQAHIIPKIHPLSKPAVSEEPASEMIQAVIVPRHIDVDGDGDEDDHFPDDLDVDLSPPHRHSTHSSLSLSRFPRLPRVVEEELPRRMPSCPPAAVTVDSDCDADSDSTPTQPPYADDHVFETSLESLSHYDSRRDSRSSAVSSNGVESMQRAASASPLSRAVTTSATLAPENPSGRPPANIKSRSAIEINTNVDYRKSKRSSRSSLSSSSSLPLSLPSSSLRLPHDSQTSYTDALDVQPMPFPASLPSSPSPLPHDSPTSSTYDAPYAQPTPFPASLQSSPSLLPHDSPTSYTSDTLDSLPTSSPQDEEAPKIVVVED